MKATGTLKKWNRKRGFGFIEDDAKGPDVFVHATVLKQSGINLENIENGARLSYEVEHTTDRVYRAVDVALILASDQSPPISV
jgi:CspA family cold shock protein